MLEAVKQLFGDLRSCLRVWCRSGPVAALSQFLVGGGSVGIVEGKQDTNAVTVQDDEKTLEGDGIEEGGLWTADETDTPAIDSVTVNDQDFNNDMECPWSASDIQWQASSIEVSPTSLSCTSAWAQSETGVDCDSDDDTLTELDNVSARSASPVTIPNTFNNPMPHPSLAYLLAPPFINSSSPLARAELRTVTGEWPPTRPLYDRTEISRGGLDSVETNSNASSLEGKEHQHLLEPLSKATSPMQQQGVIYCNPTETMMSRIHSLNVQKSQLKRSMEMRSECDKAMCRTLEQAENKKKSLEDLVITTIRQRGTNMKVMRELKKNLQGIAREEQILRGLTRPTYQRIGLLNDLIRMKQLVRDVGQGTWSPRVGSYIAVPLSMSMAALLTLTGIAIPWSANAGLKVLVLLITGLLCWPICVGYCFELAREASDLD